MSAIATAVTTGKFYASQAAAAMAGAPSVFGLGNGIVTNVDATSGMKNILNVIFDIMRYAGIAMLIYGVYEIVMSIQNNQPEAKTKGVIMALSGVVMIGMKSIITAFNITGL